MSDADEPIDCVLWYQRYGGRYYEEYDSIEEAVRAALYMEEAGSGAPVGIQVSDGRLIRNGEPPWPELRSTFRDEEEREAMRIAAMPARPTRTVTAPFDGTKVRIDAEAPGWIGSQGNDGE